MNTSKRALLAATAAAALATLTVAPAAASATTVNTVEVQLQTTSTVKESSGAWFTCPANQVMTGRKHSGDENGYTTYSCSRILINGVQADVEARSWVSAGRESSSLFETNENEIIIGRQHKGDEDGYTNYRIGALFWQGKQLRVTSRIWTSNMKESNHSASVSPYHVMTGRSHSGDENGYTKYQYAAVTLDS
ncbi:hypothetical protein FHS43_005709 [Streptosporangium becharense]|uniref:Uncharacterized protein n=1 Tax=Streptosporangium becharense TaxID=1816182 RepID=A0A7W9MKC1_9ACTN|nr:hypothetical protein [Streptosporangium becharense]MBB2914397.1 hypothetical protein [Streptosporangium becharense]MBB5823571.1 hypothetical protein [Streptosporangium becharense]